ncbi:MAG: HPP family protein [Bacteriovoracales bacterium]
MTDLKKEEKAINKLTKEKVVSKLKAKDFMDTKTVSIGPDVTIKEALLLMKENQTDGIPVTEKSGRVVGIISDYDILLQIAQKNIDEKISFKKDLISLTAESSIKDILVTFVRYKLKRIPIVDAFQKLVGMINRRDFIFKLLETKINSEKKNEAA